MWTKTIPAGGILSLEEEEVEGEEKEEEETPAHTH